LRLKELNNLTLGFPLEKTRQILATKEVRRAQKRVRRSWDAFSGQG